MHRKPSGELTHEAISAQLATVEHSSAVQLVPLVFPSPTSPGGHRQMNWLPSRESTHVASAMQSAIPPLEQGAICKSMQSGSIAYYYKAHSIENKYKNKQTNKQTLNYKVGMAVTKTE